jgi:hypothetical protein
MSVTDRDRKLLWSRSGGRCSICRRPLSADPTDADPAAVIGEECHIVARSPSGPRALRGAGDPGDDTYNNLILLCGSDHKRVDDQPNEFSSARLRMIKADHERWVANRLDEQHVPEMRIVDDPSAPVELRLVESGQQLWNALAGTMSSSVDYPDSADAAQIDLIASLLAQLEAIEIRDALNMGDTVRIQAEITEDITAVRDAGFVLYVGVRRQQLDVDGRRSPWSLAVLRFFRDDDPKVRAST